MPDMNTTKASHAKEVEGIIKQLNHCWINKKFEDMEPLFHREVVMHQTGDEDDIVGREQMIESYWEFMESAEVTDFKIADESIHVFDETAVAYYTFHIQYTVETTKYDESGAEILVLQKHDGRWKIVWRTQLFSPS